jgi:hypothetical protein
MLYFGVKAFGQFLCNTASTAPQNINAQEMSGLMNAVVKRFAPVYQKMVHVKLGASGKFPENFRCLESQLTVSRLSHRSPLRRPAHREVRHAEGSEPDRCHLQSCPVSEIDHFVEGLLHCG